MWLQFLGLSSNVYLQKRQQDKAEQLQREQMAAQQAALLAQQQQRAQQMPLYIAGAALLAFLIA